jgi:hypothetical protein
MFTRTMHQSRSKIVWHGHCASASAVLIVCASSSLTEAYRPRLISSTLLRTLRSRTRYVELHFLCPSSFFPDESQQINISQTCSKYIMWITIVTSPDHYSLLNLITTHFRCFIYWRLEKVFHTTCIGYRSRQYASRFYRCRSSFV